MRDRGHERNPHDDAIHLGGAHSQHGVKQLGPGHTRVARLRRASARPHLHFSPQEPDLKAIQAAVQEDCFVPIIKGMKLHSTDASICAAGAALISAVCASDDLGAIEALIPTHEACEHTSATHKPAHVCAASQQAFRRAFTSLTFLTAGAYNRKLRAVSEGAFEVLVDQMKYWVDDMHVQVESCQALGTICSGHAVFPEPSEIALRDA